MQTQHHNPNNDGWLLAVMLTGLQKLLTLSLDRSPALDVIRGTAMTWCEAVTDGRSWVEARDRQRFEQAFRTLSRTARRWPAPAELLEVLPQSTEAALAGPGERPKDPPELRAAMREFDQRRGLLDDGT